MTVFIIALVVAVLTAAGLAVYTIRLRRDRSELNEECKAWATENEILKDTIENHEDTIEEQREVITEQSSTITLLSERCGLLTEQVIHGTQLMSDASHEITSLRTELTTARRALIVQVGRAAGMRLEDIREGAITVE